MHHKRESILLVNKQKFFCSQVVDTTFLFILYPGFLANYLHLVTCYKTYGVKTVSSICHNGLQPSLDYYLSNVELISEPAPTIGFWNSDLFRNRLLNLFRWQKSWYENIKTQMCSGKQIEISYWCWFWKIFDFRKIILIHSNYKFVTNVKGKRGANFWKTLWLNIIHTQNHKIGTIPAEKMVLLSSCC